MVYNEKLMNEALHGDKGSLEELKSNAGSGSAEAQYFLAMYYAKANGGENDPDYQYWMQKAKDNGYNFAFEKSNLIEQEQNGEEQLDDKDNIKSIFNHDIWFYMGFEGRVNRSFYVLTTLFYFVISTSLYGYISELSQDQNSSKLFIFILVIFNIALWMFWIAQAVKRMHDLNYSGWWILIPLVPIWLFFAKGGNEENDYGEPM